MFFPARRAAMHRRLSRKLMMGSSSVSRMVFSLVMTLCLTIATLPVSCFAPLRPAFFSQTTGLTASRGFSGRGFFLSMSSDIIFDDDGEEGEEEEEEDDPYTQLASSEFLQQSNSSLANPTTAVDWGGALGTLRERIGDQEKGLVGPSNALFRQMTSQSPNEAISTFVSQASPQIVQAMSATVSSLLGGLSNPSMGVDTIVKSNGEKIGSLCFQLQMTGYMFRNAEYVLALKDLMDLRGSATMQDYRDAFDRLDVDGSGYIEYGEIEALLSDIYGDDTPPAFEVESFLRFFDANDDGRISWKEFEQGLGDMTEKRGSMAIQKLNGNSQANFLAQVDEGDDSEAAEDLNAEEPEISGSVEVELKDGTVIEVEAKDYIEDLKREAEALKATLRGEDGRDRPGGRLVPDGMSVAPQQPEDGMGGIASYIASLEGDVQSLTKGISPEVLDAMKMLVDYVIEGGSSKKGDGKAPDKKSAEMQIPGSALQQLALWQLVLGYRLRESEATGEYLKMLE